MHSILHGHVCVMVMYECHWKRAQWSSVIDRTSVLVNETVENNLSKLKIMQRQGTEAIRTQIQTLKPEGETTKI